MGRLQQYITRIVPTWLSKPVAQGLLTSFGDEADGVASDAATALRYGRLEQSPADGLDPHARNSDLRRASGESDNALRTYLRRRWLTWQESASVPGMLNQLARLGYQNCEVVTELDLRLAGVPNAFGGTQGFWFLIIHPQHPFTAAITWKGGRHWADGPPRDLWGLGGVTREQLEDLFYVIRKFKGAHTSCRFIAIDLAGDLKVNAVKWGDKAWGDFFWGDGELLGTSFKVVPLGEKWEVDPFTGAIAREFYHYSHMKERI